MIGSESSSAFARSLLKMSLSCLVGAGVAELLDAQMSGCWAWTAATVAGPD